MDTKFERILDEALNNTGTPDPLAEGVMLSLNKIGNNSINIPQGSYIVAISEPTKCLLVPREPTGQPIEIFKKDLMNMINPEVHKNAPPSEYIANS